MLFGQVIYKQKYKKCLRGLIAKFSTPPGKLHMITDTFILQKCIWYITGQVVTLH